MLCLRRKFVGHVTNSHGAIARALGHAGSLQRVRRALFKFARRHSEGALTRAILAEGWLGTLRICTAPQRERFEARDPCRGFIGHCTHARNVENDRGLTKSRMNTPHTANVDSGSYPRVPRGCAVFLYIVLCPAWFTRIGQALPAAATRPAPAARIGAAARVALGPGANMCKPESIPNNMTKHTPEQQSTKLMALWESLLAGLAMLQVTDVGFWWVLHYLEHGVASFHGRSKARCCNSGPGRRCFRLFVKLTRRLRAWLQGTIERMQMQKGLVVLRN